MHNIDDEEPFETMESVQVADIDDYLDAILKNYKGSGTGVNFMESPRSNKL